MVAATFLRDIATELVTDKAKRSLVIFHSMRIPFYGFCAEAPPPFAELVNMCGGLCGREHIDTHMWSLSVVEGDSVL